MLRVDSLAVAQDSSFVRLADKVPLSAREQAAYATIDSTMQFEKAFQPTGFLARLLVKEQREETEERTEQATEKTGVRVEPSRWGSVNLKPALRYDRVGGAHLGLAVHGASGRTWIDPERRAKLGYDARYEASFHHEVGVSLMLYHLLRLDFTRRLDRPGWGVGLSLVRFDFGGNVTVRM